MAHTEEKSHLSFIPILFSIAIYVFIVDQIYIWTHDNLALSNTFNAAIALGAIVVGFLSDALSRRIMLLLVHLLGVIFLVLFYFNSTSPLILFLLGFIYNPLSIIRASLIDNLTSASKIQFISLSFIVQFIPEIFYFLYPAIPKYNAFLYAMFAMFASLTVNLCLFFDRRDVQIKKELSTLVGIAFFLPKASKKALLTFAAFIPTQFSYFITDNLLEIFSQNPLYYSILSFGSLVGACMSTLYKKTPHAAILTIAYSLSLAISSIPVAALYFYNYQNLDIPFMFVILGSLLGFYLPFVYDVILHLVEKRFRGTACGVLDFAFSGSSLIGIILLKSLAHQTSLALLIVFIAFLLAVLFQRLSEKEI